MALIQRATITPTKLELLAAWLPKQGFAPQGCTADQLSVVGAFRFDDPDGEVGIETMLLTDGSQVLHVPVTYRPQPREGGELIGTVEHSSLGKRWVYDASTDVAYLTQLITTVLGGGQQADEFVETDEGTRPRSSSAQAHGTGVPSMGSDVGVLRLSSEPTWTDEGATRVIIVRGAKGALDQAYRIELLRHPGPERMPHLRLVGEWDGGTGTLACVGFEDDDQDV